MKKIPFVKLAAIVINSLVIFEKLVYNINEVIIVDLIEQIRKNKIKIKHDIYLLKILLECNFDEDSSDKLAYCEKIYESLDDNIDSYLKANTQQAFNIIDNDYYTLVQLLNEVKEDTIVKFKIASVVMLDNMKAEELVSFYEDVHKILDKYSNVQAACDDIYYHSGRELSKFIQDLLKYLETHAVADAKLIPVAFLKEHTNIITMYYKDWIDTFRYLRSSMKYLGNGSDKDYLQLKTLFDKLVVYYFIVITGGEN